MKVFTVLQSCKTLAVLTNERLQQVMDTHHIAVKFGNPSEPNSCAVIFVPGGLKNSESSYNCDSGLLLIPDNVLCVYCYHAENFWDIDAAIELVCIGKRFAKRYYAKINEMGKTDWRTCLHFATMIPKMGNDVLSKEAARTRIDIFLRFHKYGYKTAITSAAMRTHIRQNGYKYWVRRNHL